MQFFPRPGLLSKASSGLFAQLPQSRLGAAGTVRVGREVSQVFPDQSIDRGVPFGGVPPNGGQDILVHAQRNILHEHSICVTVSNSKVCWIGARERAAVGMPA